MVMVNPFGKRASLVLASAPPSSERAVYWKKAPRTLDVSARSPAMIAAEIAFGEAGVQNRGVRGVGVYKGRPMSRTAINIAKKLAGQTHGGMSYEQRLTANQSDAGLRALQAYKGKGRAAGGRTYTE